MDDLSTTAIILKNEPKREQDLLVSLFTERLGKVEATATSARKITSKLAGHLQPLHVVRVRLARKNGFRVVDALTIRVAPKTPAALKLLNFVDEMTAPLSRDNRLWESFRKTLVNPDDARANYRSLLAALGFDPRYGACASCEAKAVFYFNKEDFVFLCASCGKKEKTVGNAATWLAI